MREQKKREIIESTNLFKGLPQEQIDIILAMTIEKQFVRGETIFFEGDEANGFYIVTGGQVKVFKMNPLGKEHILHIFGAGEPIGEVPVFHNQPFPASAEALVKSRLIYFPRKEFVNPLIHQHILFLLMAIRRVFLTHDRIPHIATQLRVEQST